MLCLNCKSFNRSITAYAFIMLLYLNLAYSIVFSSTLIYDNCSIKQVSDRYKTLINDLFSLIATTNPLVATIMYILALNCTYIFEIYINTLIITSRSHRPAHRIARQRQILRIQLTEIKILLSCPPVTCFHASSHLLNSFTANSCGHQVTIYPQIDVS